MYIKTLELSDFRNYDNLSINFGQDTNILYGDNGENPYSCFAISVSRFGALSVLQFVVVHVRAYRFQHGISGGIGAYDYAGRRLYAGDY